MNADLVIRGAALYDGTARPPTVGDVAVLAGRIAAVGQCGPCGRAEVLDASGLCAAPGFIDLHTHSDGLLSKPREERSAVNHLRQGVTTIVTGNCGFGTLDVAGYFADLEATGVGVNVLHLIGHSSLRKEVVGEEPRPPTESELERMKALLRRGMDAGAAGMSTGLLYFPGAAATTEEIIALAKVAAGRGGIYASHIRDEYAGAVHAVAEVIRIARQAGCRAHVSHFKTIGPAARGLAARMCRLVEQARAEGVAVTADQYPYEASSTDLASTVMPKWARPSLQRRLEEDDFDGPLRAEMAGLIGQRGRAEGVLITEFKEKPEWEGRTLGDLAGAFGADCVEASLGILRIGNPVVICFALNEEDARLIAAKDYVASGSDGHFCRPGGGVHPRAYGTFPRKIREYALKRRWVTVPHAVRSATGLPADILQLPDRGYLRPGCVADVVVFDLDALTDHATYLDSHRFSTGFKRVYLAGQAAVVDDEYTGLLPGRPLRPLRQHGR